MIDEPDSDVLLDAMGRCLTDSPSPDDRSLMADTIERTTSPGWSALGEPGSCVTKTSTDAAIIATSLPVVV